MKRLVLILAVLAILLGGALLWLASAPMGGAGTTSAPTSAGAAPDGAAPSGTVDNAEADGADNSFIVCPGHPRCP
jgi:hypothetical protein